MARSEYARFLDTKAQHGTGDGFKPLWVPDFLFDFQRVLVEWAIKRGRWALLEDCGLGKTAQQLVIAENVVRHSNKHVLVITPIAVAQQTIREAEKFGMQAFHSKDGKFPPQTCIVVTNYERLHYFDSSDFAGVIGDESSVLKSFDGVRRAQITDFMRTRKYRGLCTATASPNDYIELGTHSEALGELGYMDMLGRFFVNNQNTSKPMKYRNRGQDFAKLDEDAKWRFKGHAEQPFWKWVCSWARAIRKPSDLGFDDGAFKLPRLIETEHIVKVDTRRPGFLFDMPAVGLSEQREERRLTINERCQKVAELVAHKKPAVAWCHLNDEGDLLAKLIKDATQVSGKDSDDEKEEKFAAFQSGQIRVLITKPKIGAWGLNWQHCAHMTTFASHSFEQLYQSVRRLYRFGQTSDVRVDSVVSDGESGVMQNQQRKAAQFDKMFSELVGFMNDAIKIDRANEFKNKAELPSWL